MKINVFDFDGVVSIGICPGKNDVIVTGRGIDEAEHVLENLRKRGINSAVYFNPKTQSMGRTREDSARHKVFVIKYLLSTGIWVENIFEDDDRQAEIIIAGLSVPKTGSPSPKVVTVCCPWIEK